MMWESLLFSAQRLSASSEDSLKRCSGMNPYSGCAQRLSASSEDSQGYARLQVAILIDLCSTPFGIIGRLTMAASGTANTLKFVLNAFRHHRKTHRRPINLFTTITGVLNAFRHHRKTHIATRMFRFTCTSCAQRLSASSEDSLESALPRIRVRQRAQRLSASSEDSQTASARCTAPTRCAQRLSASSEDSPWRRPLSPHDQKLCSTPFGIIGRLTNVLLIGVLQRDAVLNAFRHHRKTHNCDISRDDGTGRVLNAFRHHRKTHNKYQGRYVRQKVVLNAFRHHRKTHGPSLRLHDRECVCSTPFGIIGRLTEYAK